MITVNINDSHLEKSIIDKARLIGTTTEEIVKDLLLKALPLAKEHFSYQKLNPKENGYIIDFEVDDDITSVKDIPLFTQVDNTAKYTETLRKNAWRK